MTFDTDWTNVQNRETNFPAEPDGSVNAVLNSILWSSLATGVNLITESNWEEAWVRIDLWQTLIGPWFTRMMPDEGPIAIVVEKENVKDAIGARTNASHKSRTQFMTGLLRARYDR